MAVIRPVVEDARNDFRASDVQTIAEAVDVNAAELDRLFGNADSDDRVTTLQNAVSVDNSVASPNIVVINSSSGDTYILQFIFPVSNASFVQDMFSWIGVDLPADLTTQNVDTTTAFTRDARYSLSGDVSGGASGVLLTNALLPIGTSLTWSITVQNNLNFVISSAIPLPVINSLAARTSRISNGTVTLFDVRTELVDARINLGELTISAGTGIEMTLSADNVLTISIAN